MGCILGADSLINKTGGDGIGSCMPLRIAVALFAALALPGLFTPRVASAQFVNTILSTADVNEHSPSVAVNRRDPNNIIVATAGGGLYRTVNGGSNWEKGQFSAQLPNYGPNVLVAERKGDLYDFHLSGENEKMDRIVCQMSKDNGRTWTIVGGTGAQEGDLRRPAVGRNVKSGEFVLLWTQFDRFESPDESHKSRIMLAQSKDGKKWSDPLRVSQEGDCSNDDRTPQGGSAVISRDGYMVSTWAFDQKLYLDRSFDKGKTWLSNDIEATNQPGGCVLDIPGFKSTNALPTLIMDNSSDRYAGSLYLVWADQKNGEDDTDIWFSRSVNYGDSWTPPARINDGEKGSHQFMPAAVLDQSTGSLYVVYYDRRDHDDNQTDVYMAYSLDRGATFTNVKLSESPFQPDPSATATEFTAVDASGGIIVPAWTIMGEGGSKVVVTVIRDSQLKAQTETKEK